MATRSFARSAFFGDALSSTSAHEALDATCDHDLLLRVPAHFFHASHMTGHKGAIH